MAHVAADAQTEKPNVSGSSFLLDEVDSNGMGWRLDGTYGAGHSGLDGYLHAPFLGCTSDGLPVAVGSYAWCGAGS